MIHLQITHTHTHTHTHIYILKWVGPRRNLYILGFIHLFCSYIYVCFQLDAFVREHLYQGLVNGIFNETWTHSCLQFQTLSTEIEYHQEIWNIEKKTPPQKKNWRRFKALSVFSKLRHMHYFLWRHNAYVGLTATTLSTLPTMHLNGSRSIALHLKIYSIPKSKFRKILVENTTIIVHKINSEK